MLLPIARVTIAISSGDPSPPPRARDPSARLLVLGNRPAGPRPSLARGRGVELHASGIIDGGGRGRLFVGQSGAGKSTTARLWMDAEDVEIVSDDRVIVREAGGEWRMFGTPWHGEAALSSPAPAPLDGVFLLQQAASTRLVDVAPAEA